jgi:hypothetical protein
MACGTSLCAECANTWDGIFYCASCLAEKRRSAPGAGSWLTALPLAFLALGLLFVVSRLLVWAAVNAEEIWR